MSTLFAVDPSINSAGVARFAAGVLAEAGVVRQAATDEPMLVRAVQMARRIQEWIGRWRGELQLAVEYTQIYTLTKSKADPNKLLGMAEVDAALIALVAPAVVHCYQPGEWAGQLPKVTKGNAKKSTRALRVRSRLEGPEVAVWDRLPDTAHDAIDAIGIGLKALGRFEPRRVFAGAVR